MCTFRNYNNIDRWIYKKENQLRLDEFPRLRVIIAVADVIKIMKLRFVYPLNYVRRRNLFNYVCSIQTVLIYFIQ